MSISNIISTLETAIDNSYNAIATKNGTIPQNKNTNNLTSAIDSIVTGGGSSANIFIQDTQPSGYNGIWIADDTYKNYPIVEVNNTNSLVASSINIVKGTTYSTLLYSGFTYKFNTIIVTDSNGDEIDNVLIYYGNSLMWEELTEYLVLEYIQSSGTQYIDTGITPDSTVEIQIKALGNSFVSGTSGETLLGSRIGFRSSDFSLWWQFNYYWVWGNGDTTSYTNEAFPYKNQIIDITIGKGKLVMTNGSSTTTKTGGTATNSYNIYLFALNNNGTPAGYCLSTRIYSCKIYKNDILVRDFVPCINNNGIVCFYDKVTETFFYNAGTGDFIAGPEI